MPPRRKVGRESDYTLKIQANQEWIQSVTDLDWAQGGQGRELGGALLDIFDSHWNNYKESNSAL